MTWSEVFLEVAETAHMTTESGDPTLNTQPG